MTVLPNRLADVPRRVEPLFDVRSLIPGRRPDGPLRRGAKQVRLVAVLPSIRLALQGATSQRHGIEERLPAGRAVAAEAHVEAVREADAEAGPCRVRLEVRGADGDGRGVVWGAGGVDGADEGRGLGGVEEGVVLGVAADADVGRGGEAGEVGEEVAGEGVGVGLVS